MSRPQKGKNNICMVVRELNFLLFKVEKSHSSIFLLNKPFCYEQTSPLAVPLYSFG